MGGLCWTHKTTRNLAAALNRRGVAITHVTVGRLLHEMKYSLRTNRKRLAKTNDPDRDQLNRGGDAVASTPRSQEGVRKDTEQTSADGYPLHSLKTLLAEMGTLQRHTMRIADLQAAPTWDQLSVPSQHQRRVFEAAGVRLL